MLPELARIDGRKPEALALWLIAAIDASLLPGAPQDHTPPEYAGAAAETAASILAMGSVGALLAHHTGSGATSAAIEAAVVVLARLLNLSPRTLRRIDGQLDVLTSTPLAQGTDVLRLALLDPAPANRSIRLHDAQRSLDEAWASARLKRQAGALDDLQWDRATVLIQAVRAICAAARGFAPEAGALLQEALTPIRAAEALYRQQAEQSAQQAAHATAKIASLKSELARIEEFPPSVDQRADLERRRREREFARRNDMKYLDHGDPEVEMYYQAVAAFRRDLATAESALHGHRTELEAHQTGAERYRQIAAAFALAIENLQHRRLA